MKRQIFSSRISSILTLMGVSIGLGNVWRFPYMMGNYGGSAFLFVYVIFTVLFAIPALMAEMSLGQLSRKGTLHALRMGFGRNAGNLFGYILLVVITISGSYYAIIVANVFFTALFSIAVGFYPESIDTYRSLLSIGLFQYGLTLTIIAVSLFVIHKGLTSGIERISKIVMPLFFIALFYMIVHVVMLPGAVAKGIEFLQPDWSLLGSTEIFAAMGQAFFSVGLGGTFVVVYSGFFKKNENIPTVALFTGFGDVSASVLISLFLIPAILFFGFDMTAGPTLIFQTLPQLFDSMPGGRWVGSLFMAAIFIVAFLSLVAAYQVPYTCIYFEKPQINKTKLLVVLGILQAILALPSSLYPHIIGALDLIFGSGMQVIGSGLSILGLTWGISRLTTMVQMFQTEHHRTWQAATYLWIKWAIPIALLAVLAGYIYEVVS